MKVTIHSTKMHLAPPQNLLQTYSMELTWFLFGMFNAFTKSRSSINQLRKPLMKSFTFAVLLSSLCLMNMASAACTAKTDDVSLKDVLIGYASGILEADLTSSSLINVAAQNYRKSFTGGVGGANCFARLTSQANVVIRYTQQDRTCFGSVVVTRILTEGGATDATTAGTPPG
jgi:hypothetical protein